MVIADCPVSCRLAEIQRSAMSRPLVESAIVRVTVTPDAIVATRLVSTLRALRVIATLVSGVASYLIVSWVPVAEFTG